jgi:apolipoprotein N-acyltransferase
MLLSNDLTWLFVCFSCSGIARAFSSGSIAGILIYSLLAESIKISGVWIFADSIFLLSSFLYLLIRKEHRED